MELHFTRTNGEIDDAIDRLLDRTGGITDGDLVREMILAALKAGQEEPGRADLKLMNSTLKEMRFTSKVFGPYRDRRKVTVFGSARTRPEEPVYGMARDFGKRLVEEGFMVITGAGPGIMLAANEGAGPEHSFGVNIRLPFEQQANPVFKGNERLITYKYFFNRKVAFLKEADAIALFPGGFGTQDEAMETLTLVQTGKRTPVPLVLIDEPGNAYWEGWLDFFRKQALGRGYLSDTDFCLFRRVDTVEAAVEEIRRFYRRYHSLRYIRGRLIIRMLSPLTDARMEDLQNRFEDVFHPDGRIAVAEAVPEEGDEPEIAHLPRLSVPFNRQDFGRLRQLIDAINED